MSLAPNVDRHTYQVIAVEDDRWWALGVPELPGCFSQATTLDHVDTMIREAIAGWLTANTGTWVAEDSFNIVIDIRTSGWGKR